MLSNEHRDILDAVRSLSRAGAAQTGLTIHHSESTSSDGWTRSSVSIHGEGGIIHYTVAVISSEGDDRPVAGQRDNVSLAQQRDKLTAWIAEHRIDKEAA